MGGEGQGQAVGSVEHDLALLGCGFGRSVVRFIGHNVIYLRNMEN